MKYPKEPTKPHAPHKPSKPEKKLAHNTRLGSVEIGTYSCFNLKEFGERLSMDFGVDPSTINFEFEVEQDRCYYDEATYHIVVSIFSKNEIDDPEYEKKLALFEKEMDKYAKDYAKYKKQKKAYKDKMAQYELEMDEYNLEWAKSQVKRYEEKLSK